MGNFRKYRKINPNLLNETDGGCGNNTHKYKTKEDIEHYFAQASFYAYAIAEMYSVPLPDIVIAIAVNGLKEPLVFESKPKLHAKFLVDAIKTYYELEKNREKEEESKLLICN